MSKFNLKTYKKTNGDEHIDSKLQDEHNTAPNEINEKQLEDYRAGEPEVTTEKQLEKNRKATNTVEATEITEKQLDTDKGKFDIEFRNASAHEGDLPKLEEQRLKGNPVEDEKYEDASETPKAFRWWESAPNSPDGLKLAQKKSVVQKTAQLTEELTFDKPRWEETYESDDTPFNIIDEDEDEEAASAADALNPDFATEDYDYESFTDIKDFAIDDEGEASSMAIKESKDLPDLSAVYIVLKYDTEEFRGDELMIKQEALNKVLRERPELKGIVDVSDFYDVKEDGAQGEVKMRLIDERIRTISDQKELESNERIDMGDTFSGIPLTEINAGGTSMVSGEISIHEEITDENRDYIIENAISYIRDKYSLENIDIDSLELSNLADGKISFLTEAPEIEIEEEKEKEKIPSLATGDFPIVVADVEKSFNVKKK